MEISKTIKHDLLELQMEFLLMLQFKHKLIPSLHPFQLLGVCISCTVNRFQRQPEKRNQRVFFSQHFCVQRMCRVLIAFNTVTLHKYIHSKEGREREQEGDSGRDRGEKRGRQTHTHLMAPWDMQGLHMLNICHNPNQNKQTN